METISIDIEPPITEYCRKCDYEASYSFNSHRCKCPKCDERLYNGSRPLPEKAVYVSRSYGRYDLCSTDKDYGYTFINLPKGIKGAFISSEELEYDEPLVLAEELRELYDKYLYTSSKEEIRKVVEFLSENEEKQEELRSAETIKHLKEKLYQALHEA